MKHAGLSRKPPTQLSFVYGVGLFQEEPPYHRTDPGNNGCLSLPESGNFLSDSEAWASSARIALPSLLVVRSNGKPSPQAVHEVNRGVDRCQQFVLLSRPQLIGHWCWLL